MRSHRGDLPALLLCISAASSLAIACSAHGADPVVAETVSVELRVGPDAIEIRRVEPISKRRLRHHVDALTPLEVRLVAEDGREVVRSRIRDFRWARSEAVDPDTGRLSRVDFRLSSGIGTIRLPAVEGELVVLEPRGGGAVELGRAHFDPAAAEVSARRLPLDDDEVLGDPVLISGGGGKQGAIDILLLPEAYQEEQLAEFHQTAVAIADGLMYQADFAAYADRVNVWYIDVRSDEDQLDTGGLFGDSYDTAFDGRWGGGGVLGIGNVPDECTTYGDGDDARDLGDQHDMDAVVMIANVDGVRAVQTDDMINMGRDNSGTTLAHELGHLLLDLGDEYVEDTSGFEGFRCGVHSFFGLHERANVQADWDDLPWWDLLSPGVAIPTEEEGADTDTVGAFEGANHCADGWYRPEVHCLMRDHDGMCAACRRELDTLMGALSVAPPSCPEEWRGDGLCDLCLDGDPDCEVLTSCDHDGWCGPAEHCSSCPEDCGDCPLYGGCGDGACAANETDSSCPADCGCSAGAQCSNGPAPYGCYCDSQCESAGDCCADYQPSCE